MSSRFAELVQHELADARSKHLPLNSLHEGYAVILEQLEEVKAQVFKKRQSRHLTTLLRELVQTAAMCQRLAEDVICDNVPWEELEIHGEEVPPTVPVVQAGKDGAA
jgi:hypothetical protein